MYSSLLGALLTAGCQTVHVTDPLPAGWAANDQHARTEFWDQLSKRPVATNDEMFHALLIYASSTDSSPDYAARLKEMKICNLVPPDFAGGADEPADRGTFAYALVHLLKIDGGVNMRLFGPTPRYAVRALEYRNIYPTCSANQGISGAQFVGIMQKAEEYERGNPADSPAVKLPSESHHEGPLAAARRKAALAVAPQPISPTPIEGFDLTLNEPTHEPIYLDVDSVPDFQQEVFFLDDTTKPSDDAIGAGGVTPPKKLNVIVTGVEGDSAEARKDDTDTWVRAKVGMVLHEKAEFRTGAKSAIRFIIPPGQTYTLDSQGTTKVLEAVAAGKKVKTDVAMAHGRVRTDIDREAAANNVEPIRIEQAGIEHDATIRSPNSALALRGTKVSLFDQAGFDPEAISLTGSAIYINTRGQRVPFGGTRRVSVSGSRSSPADLEQDRGVVLTSNNLAQLDFQNRETTIAIQRGGFVIGDVIVGDLHLSDFHDKLPGALDFVLQWSGGPQMTLHDLNMEVFSPLNSAKSPDFVGNPPFIDSLNPSSPRAIQTRASLYPETSRSGGAISKNSVGPDGLELASWPANYPGGVYRVVVFNFLDANPPPTKFVNPVTYTIDVFLNGNKLVNTVTGSVGFLQTELALSVSVPASSTSVVSSSVKKPGQAVDRSAVDRITPAHGTKLSK